MIGIIRKFPPLFICIILTSCDIGFPSIEFATDEIPVNVVMYGGYGDNAVSPTSTVANITAYFTKEIPISFDPPDVVSLNGKAFKKGAGHFSVTLENADVVPGSVYTLAFDRGNPQPEWSLPLTLPVQADLSISSAKPRYTLNENMDLIWNPDNSVPEIQITFSLSNCNFTYNGSNLVHLTAVYPNDNSNNGRYVKHNSRKLQLTNNGSYNLSLDPSFLFTETEIQNIKSVQFQETNYDLFCQVELEMLSEKFVHHETYKASILYHDTDSAYFNLNISDVLN